MAAEEVFVPAHRTLAVDETKGCRGPGLAVNDAALYRLPVFAMFPYVLAGCALGTAEGALEGYVAATRRRVGSYSGARVADHVPIQIKIAEAAVRIEAAEYPHAGRLRRGDGPWGGRHGARFHDEDPVPP